MPEPPLAALSLQRNSICTPSSLEVHLCYCSCPQGQVGDESVKTDCHFIDKSAQELRESQIAEMKMLQQLEKMELSGKQNFSYTRSSVLMWVFLKFYFLSCVQDQFSKLGTP